jgi:hypothetical protein
VTMHKLPDTTLRSLLKKGRDVATPTLLLASIHPIADKACPRKLPIAPVLWDMPLPTGAQRALFASGGCDGYATYAAGPPPTRGALSFLPAPHRPENALPSSPAFFVLSRS